MDFNLEEQVNSIIQARKGKEQAWHIWLEGFYQIINNAELDYFKIQDHIKQKLEKTPVFTKYWSKAQFRKIAEGIFIGYNFNGDVSFDDIHIFDKKVHEIQASKQRNRLEDLDFFYVHLPVNNKYHLEFPLLKERDICRFVYTTCSICDDQDGHGFPEICLRQSVNIQGEIPMMYDNRASINHQDKELIFDSYKSFSDFVENTRVKN